MGILDNITSTVNRGTESAGRAAEKLKLKNQLNEINKHRQQLAAQLGASLYDVTSKIPQLRSGREALFDGIAECDRERAACQAKISELEAMSQAATAAATTFKCVVCGAGMAGDDLFCSGCGTPAVKAKPAAVAVAVPANGPKCVSCGAAMAEGDMFCMTCGAKQDAPAAQATPVQQDSATQPPAQQPAPVVVEDVTYTYPETSAPTQGGQQ